MIDKEFLNDFEEQQAIGKIVEQGLAGREQSNVFLRSLIAVVLVIMIGMPLFGTAFPALAQNIPLIGGLFSNFGNEGRTLAIDEHVVEIGLTRDINAMTVTITEAVFDGQIIHVAYTIESPITMDLSAADYDFWLNDLTFNDNRRFDFNQWSEQTNSLGRISKDSYIYAGFYRIFLPELATDVRNIEVKIGFGLAGHLTQTSFTLELDIIPRTLIEVIDGYVFADTDFYSEFRITDISISPLGVFVYTNGSWQHNFTLRDNIGEQHISTYRFDGSATSFSDGSGTRTNWRLFPLEIHPDATDLIIELYQARTDGMGNVISRTTREEKLVIPLP